MSEWVVLKVEWKLENLLSINLYTVENNQSKLSKIVKWLASEFLNYGLNRLKEKEKLVAFAIVD